MAKLPACRELHFFTPFFPNHVHNYAIFSICYQKIPCIFVQGIFIRAGNLPLRGSEGAGKPLAHHFWPQGRHHIPLPVVRKNLSFMKRPWPGFMFSTCILARWLMLCVRVKALTCPNPYFE
jgi:hypothetical protein